MMGVTHLFYERALNNHYLYYTNTIDRTCEQRGRKIGITRDLIVTIRNNCNVLRHKKEEGLGEFDMNRIYCRYEREREGKQ